MSGAISAVGAAFAAIAPETAAAMGIGSTVASGAAAAVGGEAISWGALAPSVAAQAAATAGSASELMTAGRVVASAGSLMSGIGSSNQADYEAELAENNAQIADRNATLATQAGQQQQEISEQKTRAEVGSATAAEAKSGLEVGSGSNLDVQQSIGELGQQNSLNIQSDALLKAYGYKTQSAADIAQAEMYKAAAPQDLAKGIIGAVTQSTLMGQQQGNQWQGYLANTGMVGG